MGGDGRIEHEVFGKGEWDEARGDKDEDGLGKGVGEDVMDRQSEKRGRDIVSPDRNDSKALQ